MSDNEMNWVSVCDAAELTPLLGVRALLNEEQVAIFKVKDALYALNAIDPFSKAAVLSRGIVGDLKNQLVVASPLYKQHFNLETGICLEDESVKVKTYAVRESEGKIQLATN
ncbi:nitrite reductase (NADH) small subunit [Alteromonadaceae bacterium 2753L.S.0a.02]|nr:nitrite reductase (NADH) small subunit [Alteromonadaceae bacterium 2753L.S.0a.02]